MLLAKIYLIRKLYYIFTAPARQSSVVAIISLWYGRSLIQKIIYSGTKRESVHKEISVIQKHIGKHVRIQLGHDRISVAVHFSISETFRSENQRRIKS